MGNWEKLEEEVGLKSRASGQLMVSSGPNSIERACHVTKNAGPCFQQVWIFALIVFDHLWIVSCNFVISSITCSEHFLGFIFIFYTYLSKFRTQTNCILRNAMTCARYNNDQSITYIILLYTGTDDNSSESCVKAVSYAKHLNYAQVDELSGGFYIMYGIWTYVVCFRLFCVLHYKRR